MPSERPTYPGHARLAPPSRAPAAGGSVPPLYLGLGRDSTARPQRSLGLGLRPRVFRGYSRAGGVEAEPATISGSVQSGPGQRRPSLDTVSDLRRFASVPTLRATSRWSRP
jgi:hypothetical protein